MSIGCKETASFEVNQSVLAIFSAELNKRLVSKSRHARAGQTIEQLLTYKVVQIAV